MKYISGSIQELLAFNIDTTKIWLHLEILGPMALPQPPPHIFEMIENRLTSHPNDQKENSNDIKCTLTSLIFYVLHDDPFKPKNRN